MGFRDDDDAQRERADRLERELARKEEELRLREAELREREARVADAEASPRPRDPGKLSFRAWWPQADWGQRIAVLFGYVILGAMALYVVALAVAFFQI